MYPAERTQISLRVEVLVFDVHVVRFGGVEPPGIHTQIENVLFHCFPVDVPCCRIIRVVRFDSGFGRPRFEMEQCFQTVHLLIHFCPRTEGGPYGDHDVGVLLVHVVDHFFGAFDAGSAVVGILVFSVREEFHVFRVTHLVDVAGILEFHGVPVLVAAPVLPVLDDSIQRNFQLPVFVYDFAQFVRTFVAFAALPEAQCPERIQRGLSGQVAYSGYDSVGVAAVDEVVVGTVAYFRVEGGFLRIVEEGGRGVIVPVEGIAFDGVDEGDTDTHVLVAEKEFLIALVHFAGLLLAQAVDHFVLIQQKSLTDIVGGDARVIERGKLCTVVFVGQQPLP